MAIAVKNCQPNTVDLVLAFSRVFWFFCLLGQRLQLQRLYSYVHFKSFQYFIAFLRDFDRRLSQDLAQLRSFASENGSFIIDETPFGNNQGQVTRSGRILIVRVRPNLREFNQGSFKVELNLTGYPFRSPNIRFLTPIYHPLVDREGNQRLVMAIS